MRGGSSAARSSWTVGPAGAGGFGGSFAVDYPQVSTAILGKKLTNATETAADVVISDNPGCIMQLRGGLIASGSPTRAMHLAELIAERLPGRR